MRRENRRPPPSASAPRHEARWVLEEREGGGHAKVTLNGRGTVVPRHAKDLKTGTFRANLKQLGLTEADLEV